MTLNGAVKLLNATGTTTLNFTGSNGYSLAIPTLSYGVPASANLTLNAVTSVQIDNLRFARGGSGTVNLYLKGASTGNVVNNLVKASDIYTNYDWLRIYKQETGTWTWGAIMDSTQSPDYLQIEAGTMIMSGQITVTTASGKHGVYLNGGTFCYNSPAAVTTQTSGAFVFNGGTLDQTSGSPIIFDDQPTDELERGLHLHRQ